MTRPRWLLFVHQLPGTSSNLRVRTWRRLQQIGALPVKQAVYVLPDSPAAREDFEWLTCEVTEAGGEASVFAADVVDAWSSDRLVEAFTRARRAAYASLAAEVERAVKRAEAPRRRGRRPRLAGPRLLALFRERLGAIERVDFFGGAGRETVVTLLGRLEAAAGADRPSPARAAAAVERDAYQARRWVTRPRPGVDRMSSAWLIRRFIDRQARFEFAADRESLPSASAVPFDMFGVAFGHRGDACTFETLCAVFGIADPAVARVAGIVHDLDLKDGRFGAPEAATVGALIEGLQLATPEDELLLERGMTLFESLYQAFARDARSATRPSRVSKGSRPARRRR